MNDEISKKIIEWIEQLKDFASNEIPPFVQEVANYGFFENLWMSFGYLTLMGLGLFLIMFGISDSKKNAEFGARRIVIGAILILVFGLCLIFDSVPSMIKAKCAPKLYVIERFIKN